MRQLEESIERYLEALETATGSVDNNLQAAVDIKHHLVVAHQVTNVGSDRGQLAHMANEARSAMGKTTLECAGRPWLLERQVGLRKVRFKGLQTNAQHLLMLFAQSNLWIARRKLMGMVRPQMA